MLQTRINITEPNGVQRMMPLTQQGLVIGRAPDNGLVINYPSTSRYHAQISFDGVNYNVTDLNSGNGTFMGQARLTPNQPTVWTPGTPLQIGDVVLYLEQGEYQTPSQQMQMQQPVRKDRQNTATIAGWTPDEIKGQEKKNVGRIWLLIVIFLMVMLCACSALAVGGYFYFGQSGL